MSHRHLAVARAPAISRLTLACCLWLAVAAAAATAAASERAPFDIDTADAATLAAALPGIGPVKARRIVEYRKRHGPFETLDALLGVRGIGPATLGGIRAHLESGEPGADRSTGRGGSRSPGGAGEGEGGAATDGTGGARGGADASGAGEPRSTMELERATRDAVRRIVAGARADAARVQ